MWRRDWGGLLAAVAGGVAIGVLAWAFAPGAAEQPLAVPAGDQEVAWLHTPTSFEAWENFVWAARRAEMLDADGRPSGLLVDDSAAYPDKTTAIPEIIIRRAGFAGALRIRWYKTTDRMTQEMWVAALAKRDPPPLAVLGGWSSDRAKSLADAMREARWTGAKPLLLLTTATADKVDPEVDAHSGGQGPALVAVYDRSFRFCFTNRQMADAVADFVLSDPRLRPGRRSPQPPGVPRAVALFAAGTWEGLCALGCESIPAYAIEWQDDPYSTDLSHRFRQALGERVGHPAGCPRLDMIAYSVPFSTGRQNRPNTAEAEAAAHILAHLPPPDTRTVLVIPTVSAPARRTLRTLLQGNPQIGRQLVAVTGDGISVNTFFRDRDFAWPMRSLRVPFVSFAHADPFAWDRPNYPPAPPPGYELAPPGPGEVRSTTEDLQHYNRLVRVVARAAFPDGGSALASSADVVAANLRALDPPFFDPAGDRLPGAGEHVIVLRPTFPEERKNGPRQPEGTLEVYTRRTQGAAWTRLHSLPLGPVSGGNSE
jgi:hypothetical protein